MEYRRGMTYGVSAYLLWGVFPLFFMLLKPINAFETVPWRVMTGLAFCLIVLAFTKQWGQLGAILRSPRQVGWFALSTVLLYINWQIFIIGVVTDRIIETALGYFINPLVTILIGVFVRRERLRPAQWTAVGVAAVGVLVSALAYGSLPWIALGVACSFGLYGAVRKQVSEGIEALPAFTVETLVAMPIAMVQLAIVAAVGGGLHAFEHGPVVTVALLLSGTATAVPLLLFGAANRRIPLSHMGFLQFFTPILSFFTGWLLFGEEMPASRWIGFVAVWIAISILIWDMIRTLRASRARNAAAAPALD